jgi:hypothetical protein
MQYGNCLFGALVILWNKRKEKPKFMIRFRPQSYVPHFMITTENELHHYKLDRDVLPWPFCYFLFQGSFQSLDPQKELLFMNKNGSVIWILSLAFCAGMALAFLVNS